MKLPVDIHFLWLKKRKVDAWKPNDLWVRHHIVSESLSLLKSLPWFRGFLSGFFSIYKTQHAILTTFQRDLWVSRPGTKISLEFVSRIDKIRRFLNGVRVSRAKRKTILTMRDIHVESTVLHDTKSIKLIKTKNL